MKSLIESIGLALYQQRQLRHHGQWNADVDAVAAAIANAPALCTHKEHVQGRYNDFVTLCETGVWPKEEKKEPDKAKEPLDEVFEGMGLKVYAVGYGDLMKMLFGEDSDHVPDSTPNKHTH